jgi:hypothetical protein
MAREECRATWTELYGNILSAEYANKVPTSLDTNPYHADFSTATREYPSYDLPPGMMDFEAIKAQETKVCANSNYKNSFKKMQGCNDKYLLDYPSYYAKNYVVNPTYGIAIKDVGGAYADYLKYKIDPYSYRMSGISNYIIISQIQGEFAVRATGQR